jgi:hypothetical protein
MKLVKHFVCAVLLISAIAVTTPAGEQDTPGYTAPPPPPRVMTTTDETPISSSNTTQQDGGITADTSEFIIFEALTALLSVY